MMMMMMEGIDANCNEQGYTVRLRRALGGDNTSMFSNDNLNPVKSFNVWTGIM